MTTKTGQHCQVRNNVKRLPILAAHQCFSQREGGGGGDRVFEGYILSYIEDSVVRLGLD